jgi:F-box-like
MQTSMLSDVFAQIESSFNPSHSQTGIHDPSARFAAISTVDKGIDAARQLVRSLLTRRNALVPISLLPPEILARVFHLLVLEEPPLSGGRRLGWIRVTHVCRHWRQVALNDSSLWAKIWGIPTNTKWISEMLARAKNAPLDIEFNAFTRSSAEALPMIAPHLSHTRQLRFHCHSALHTHRLREIYSWDAPALELFELTIFGYYPIAFPDLGGNILFNGHTPRLRTFSLSRVVIPWSLIPRGQLTQLKIAHSNEDFNSPGDLGQLIDVLVNCPALEILALDFCLPSQLTEFPHGRTIHLPHLSRLRLCGSTSRIMNMLKMLKLRFSTTLHLNCTSKITSINNDSEGALITAISEQFQSPAPIEFKSLTVTIRRYMPNSLNITASTFPSTLRNRQTQSFEGDIVGNAELVLSFNRLSKPGHSTDLLKQACKMLPISNLEFISMSASSTIDINWVELFSCCANVTTMQAIGYGTSSLVRALTAPTVTNAGSSKEGSKGKYDKRESALVQPASTVVHAHTAIFPKLKFLGLTELYFFESKHASGIPFDVFERGLQQRMAASGAPLELLRIRYCDISAEHANDLEKLVRDVHWNEDEDLIDGSEDFDHHEPHLFYSRGTVLRDSDSDGWNESSD